MFSMTVSVESHPSVSAAFNTCLVAFSGRLHQDLVRSHVHAFYTLNTAVLEVAAWNTPGSSLPTYRVIIS